MKRWVTTAGMYVPIIILSAVICKYFQNLIGARLTPTDVIDMLEDVSDDDYAYDRDEDECAGEVICEGSNIEFRDFDTAEVDDLKVNPQTNLDEEKYVTLMISVYLYGSWQEACPPPPPPTTRTLSDFVSTVLQLVFFLTLPVHLVQVSKWQAPRSSQ